MEPVKVESKKRGQFFSAIFALRIAPDPEEVKDELENFKERIKSKPLPFLSGKGKKKKEKGNENSSYDAPTYTPTLPTYDFTTSRPITFNFDLDENFSYNSVNNHRNRHDEDDFTSNLIGPAVGLGGTPGP